VVSDQSYRYRDWRADGAPAGSSPRVIGIELSADARSVTRDIACSDLCTGLLEGAVYTWLTGTPPDNLLFTEEQLHLVQVLDSLPSKQRANWLDRYLEAVWSGESLPDMPNTPRWSS
jgi:DNA-directed RNA polymerase specialized sigma24 family protein